MKTTLPILLGVGIIAVALYMTFTSEGNSASLLKAENQMKTETTGAVVPSDLVTTPSIQPHTSGITLSIISPSGNSTVSNALLTVRGKTVPNAEVFVNDTEVRADSSGVFAAPVTLDEGENYILIVANDDIGNYSEKDLYVTYTP